MKRSYITPLVLAVVLFSYGKSYAQAPPDLVTSDGYQDTAVGTGVLDNIIPNFIAPGANRNTGVGAYALLQDTTGASNTAVGAASLSATTTGGGNTAVGSDTLTLNITGFNNTATGLSALAQNTSGIHNTAIGAGALFGNITGQFNTASGDQALAGGNNPDMTGNYNTADGAEALFSNTAGQENTAAGSFALTLNTTGAYNTASGYQSLSSNRTGSNNTAVGINALGTNEGGSNNIAIGANAGYYIRGSLYNIDIGNVGNQEDVGLIRIGTSGQQTAAYIAGIASARVTGSAVYITSTGQLGVLASSERYKTGIAPMGVSTEKLGQLRPVTFHLKADPKGGVQYGLIAEEVAKVYPELVIRDEHRKIQGVRYEELAPMLLNEAQQQRQQIRQLQRELVEVGQLKQQVKELQAVLAKLEIKSELVAQR